MKQGEILDYSENTYIVYSSCVRVFYSYLIAQRYLKHQLQQVRVWGMCQVVDLTVYLESGLGINQIEVVIHGYTRKINGKNNCVEQMLEVNKQTMNQSIIHWMNDE